jgi:palmitoyl-protein thioesterase
MARFASIVSLLAAVSLVHSIALPTTRADDDDDTPLPLIIWHGLGDNYAADGLASVAELAEETNPGTLVYIIRIDDDASADRTATFFGNVTTQLEKVCADLAAHPILSTAPAVDALGFSQGGQFLRGYVERCNFPPVRSLVTFGSQHNGISEFQTCGASDWICKGAQALLRYNTWSAYVQNRLVPAQYFRDPTQYEQYLENSNFLADINNERLLKNKTYKENLEKLEKFVMYIFEDDETVVPMQSGWFAEVNGTDVQDLRDRALYKEDWLGLKALDKKGALEFKTTPGGHMTLSDKLLEKVFKDYYGPYGRKFGDKTESLYAFQEEL